MVFRLHLRERAHKLCTNQQPPQRGGAVPDTVWVEMAVGIPEGPSYPWHSPCTTIFLPGWFPFLSVISIIKLQCLHQAASCAISGCLSSSPIPLFLRGFSTSPTSHSDSFHSFILWAGSLSPNFLFHFRFGQTWSEAKTLQIVLESFCIHSPVHASFYFS